MQPQHGLFRVRRIARPGQAEIQVPVRAAADAGDHGVDGIGVRADGEVRGDQAAHGPSGTESVGDGGATASDRPHRHVSGPDAAACHEVGGVAGGRRQRHVDRDRVGAGALVGAVAHLEGEARIGTAALHPIRGEDELVRVDVGLRDGLIHHDRRAVVRQRALPRQGDDLHAHEAVAGVRVGEVEVRRREGVGHALARRHRVVRGRRRGSMELACEGERQDGERQRRRARPAAERPEGMAKE